MTAVCRSRTAVPPPPLQRGGIHACSSWITPHGGARNPWRFLTGLMRDAGWRPIAVYSLATVFNTVVALAAAWAIFG